MTRQELLQELRNKDKFDEFLMTGKKVWIIFEFPIHNRKLMAADDVADVKRKVSILREMGELPNVLLMIHGNGWVSNVLYI